MNDELHIELVEEESISINVVESDVCAINLEVNEVNFVADAVFEQRLSDLEESTDGLHLGVDPLTYYILARDN